MRTALAEKLLIQIMKWTPDEVQKERPLLQALSNFKYDEYQQYSPGMRFIESLVRWLKQFDNLEEKHIAYKFLKEQLIFISSDQISHLVTLAYPDKVEPALIEKTALELGCNKNSVNKIIDSDEFKRNKRQTLFIGLSDGSKIDFFRRCSGIDNEQVFATYYISEDKANDMKQELSLKLNSREDKFKTVFLIDDFTASGRSYFRLEQSKGKICKFLISLFNNEENKENHLKDLIYTDGLLINVLFYIATDEALSLLDESAKRWIETNNVNLKINIDAIQIIPSNIKENVTGNDKLMKIIKQKEYFDDSIIDKHYRQGKCDNPFLGFNECSLPLVLNHNTPNNSLPILWLQEDKKFNGLFPRVTRHKE